MRTRLLLPFLASLLAVSVASAQDTARAFDPARFEAQLHYRQGTVSVGNGIATLQVPEGWRYLGPEDSEKLLSEAWGNPPGSGALGMIFPAGVSPLSDEGWGVVITFDEDGYVEDDDAATINYDNLLKQMREETAGANGERRKAGYPAVDLVGWAETPHYDAAAHKLYWAENLKFEGSPGNTLNYKVRVLGRRGVLVLNAVSSMDQLPAVRRDMQQVIAFTGFNDGHRYADFVPGTDKVAAYGIAALVAGKVAAKAGLLKVILGGLLAAKKLLVAAALAVAAWVRRLLGREKARPAAG
jgi:uncharacterized membrane-anchored protein